MLVNAIHKAHRQIIESYTACVKTYRRDRLFTIVFAAMVVLYAAPFFSVRYLPFQDFGAHLQIIHLWKTADTDPGLIGKTYTTSLRPTPYLTYYGCVRLLSFLFPLERANLLCIGLYAVSFPLAFLYLLVVFNRDYRYALFSFVFINNTSLIYGFIPNAISYLFFMICLALLKKQLDSPRVFRELLLLFSLVLLYFSHNAGFFAFAIVAPVIFFAQVHRPKEIVRRALFAIPTLAIAFFWSGTSLNLNKLSVSMATISESFSIFSAWINDIYLEQIDEVLLLSVAISVLLTVVFNNKLAPLKSNHAEWSLGLASVFLLVVFFTIPKHITTPVYQWMVQGRLAVPVGIMFLLIPRVNLQGIRQIVLLPMTVVLVMGGWSIFDKYLSFNHMASHIDNIIEAIPANKRILPLYFNSSDGIHRGFPLLHLVELYQIRKGGELGTDLIAKEVIPVKRIIPAPPAPFWQASHTFSYQQHGKYYDYFLAMFANNEKIPDSLGGDPGKIKLIKKSGRFAVYKHLNKNR